VGHIDKKGGIAGPKTLEHMVDAVFLFEGEKKKSRRELSSSKNRFGATDIVAKLKMTSSGLKDLGVEGGFDEDDFDEEEPGDKKPAAKKKKGKVKGKAKLRIVKDDDRDEYDAAFEDHYGEDS